MLAGQEIYQKVTQPWEKTQPALGVWKERFCWPEQVNDFLEYDICVNIIILDVFISLIIS